MSQFFYCQGSNVNNRAENVHSFSIRLKYRSIDLPKIGKTAGQFSNKDTYLDQAKIRLHTAMYVVHSTAANNQKISEKSKVRGCDGVKSRRGVTEEVPAVGFCLGSGLFGSYNSD